MDGTGTAYYISDVLGHKLLFSGSLGKQEFSAQCWQDIKRDGIYVLRVGGALDKDSGDHSWRFCGATGRTQDQLQFRVVKGRCEPVQILNGNEYCTAGPGVISFNGQLLLLGLDSGVTLQSSDKDLLALVIASSVDMLTEVNIGNLYYSDNLGGVVAEFTATLEKSSEYDGHDSASIQKLQSNLQTQLTNSISSQEFTTLLHQEPVTASTSASTRVLDWVTSVRLLNFALSGVSFSSSEHKVQEAEVSQEDQTFAVTGRENLVVSARSSSALTVMMGVAASVLVIAGVAALYIRSRGKFSALPVQESKEAVSMPIHIPNVSLKLVCLLPAFNPKFIFLRSFNMIMCCWLCLDSRWQRARKSTVGLF